MLAEFPALTAWAVGGKVSSASVDEWCVRASNEIDAEIAGKYAVPVDVGTSPKAFSLLKEICVWKVYPRVAGVLNLNTGDPKSSGKTSADFEKKAADRLEKLRNGTMKLTDALPASSDDGVSTSSTASNCTPRRKFKTDRNDW